MTMIDQHLLFTIIVAETSARRTRADEAPNCRDELTYYVFSIAAQRDDPQCCRHGANKVSSVTIYSHYSPSCTLSWFISGSYHMADLQFRILKQEVNAPAHIVGIFEEGIGYSCALT